MGFSQRSWLGLALGVPGWIFVGLVAMALAIAVADLATLDHGWALAYQGVETTGQVTALTINRHSCGDNGADTCANYMVLYRFDAAGQTRSASSAVSGSFYNGLQVGQTQPVRYVAADPSVNEIELGVTLIGAVFQALLAAVIVLGAGGLLAWRVRGARRMVWLRAHGVMRRADVLTRQPSKVRVNNVPQFVITWRDKAGGTGQSRGRRLGDLPDTGAQITVYADPGGFLPAVWEGDCGRR